MDGHDLMKVNVEIFGLKEVTETLTQVLPASVQRFVVAAALREAAKPMITQAKRDFRALGGSGSLAIATTAWRDRKRESRGGQHFASVAVGPKRSNRRALAAYGQFYGKKFTPRAFKLGVRHGHLVEFGTKRGAPARNVLGRALSAHGEAAVKTFGDVLARRIEAAAERQARKTQRGSRR